MQSNDWGASCRLEKRLISAVVSTDDTRMKERTLISRCLLILSWHLRRRIQVVNVCKTAQRKTLNALK